MREAIIVCICFICILPLLFHLLDFKNLEEYWLQGYFKHLSWRADLYRSFIDKSYETEEVKNMAKEDARWMLKKQYVSVPTAEKIKLAKKLNGFLNILWEYTNGGADLRMQEAVEDFYEELLVYLNSRSRIRRFISSKKLRKYSRRAKMWYSQRCKEEKCAEKEKGWKPRLS